MFRTEEKLLWYNGINSIKLVRCIEFLVTCQVTLLSLLKFLSKMGCQVTLLTKYSTYANINVLYSTSKTFVKSGRHVTVLLSSFS